MNPDTADLALTERAIAWERGAAWPVPGTRRSRALARVPVVDALALRDTWRALAGSRLAVWAAGTGAVLAFGFGPARKVIQHADLTLGLGSVGNVLAAPAARWDAAWYLLIVRAGYAPALGSATTARSAFFPLYPLVVRGLSTLLVPEVLAGVLVSVAAMAAALYFLHRLTALEVRTGSLGAAARPLEAVASGRPREVARLAVLVVAFSPVAFFLSAVYSESLYLALSVGVFWCARRGRWMWAGGLGALAGATRPIGVLLLAPAIILYLYGPREDAPPELRARGWARPLYRVRRDICWLGLIPAGLVCFMAYMWLGGGSPLAPFSAESLWGRELALPVAGLWQGAVAAFDGARQLLSFQGGHSFMPFATGSPLLSAAHDVPLFLFALGAVVAVGGVIRALPAAYGVYVILALGLALSYPVASEPLMSLPRFLLVLFPLAMWMASWFHAHPRARTPALALSTVSLVLLTGAFATWHWVS
jgi:hypothetical protein